MRLRGVGWYRRRGTAEVVEVADVDGVGNAASVRPACVQFQPLRVSRHLGAGRLCLSALQAGLSPTRTFPGWKLGSVRSDAASGSKPLCKRNKYHSIQ